MEIEIDGYPVKLIDTPGFDDTEKSDLEILKILAAFLEDLFVDIVRMLDAEIDPIARYRKKILLSGMIYIHRISDIRMGGASRRSFNLFLKICGQSNYKNIIIMTTMWDKVGPEEGRARENALIGDGRFFQPVLHGGARILRHTNTEDSAMNVARAVLVTHNPVALRIQVELVDEGKSILETEVGMAVHHEMQHLSHKFKDDMKNLRLEMKQAKRERDKKSVVELERESRQARAALAGIEQELKKMERNRTRKAKKRGKKGRKISKMWALWNFPISFFHKT